MRKKKKSADELLKQAYALQNDDDTKALYQDWAETYEETMMSGHIDYYFTSISPFAYLGQKPLMEIAAKHGKQVNYKPFNIFGVWENSGAVPPGKRPAVRQRYRLVEIQRAAVMRNTCMNAKPEFFPTNPEAADLCICALNLAKADAAGFSLALGRAVWERNLQVANEVVLVELLNDEGHDGKAILEQSKSAETKALRETNTKEAVKNDAVGAPAYVYEGEVFWGQDRLEYLEQMIASGRSAFSADI